MCGLAAVCKLRFQSSTADVPEGVVIRKYLEYGLGGDQCGWAVLPVGVGFQHGSCSSMRLGCLHVQSYILSCIWVKS